MWICRQLTVDADGISDHLGTTSRTLDSTHSCGWDLYSWTKIIWILVALPIYLHVDSRRNWVGVGRMGVMFDMPVGRAGVHGDLVRLEKLSNRSNRRTAWSSVEVKEKPCPRTGVSLCCSNQKGTRKWVADKSGSGRCTQGPVTDLT